MRITKRQLKRIIKEEKARLLSEQPTSGPTTAPAPGVGVYRVTMVIAVAEDSSDYILQSVEDGMEFDEANGEGILEYDIKQER
jgi:hypothetical protein